MKDADFTEINTGLPEGEVVFAIGDVHGHDKLLNRAHRHIRDEARDCRRATAIHLGDYIDRGPAPLACVKAVMAFERASGIRNIALPGNHELAFLNALNGDRHDVLWWLEIIGGYPLLDEVNVPGSLDWKEAMQYLSYILAPEIAWMNSLPAAAQIGKLVFVHAGVPATTESPSDLIGMEWRRRPCVTITETEDHPLWVRDSFFERADAGPWPCKSIVVHGHTIVRQPLVRPGRVAIDTGSFLADGALTVATFTPGGVKFTMFPHD